MARNRVMFSIVLCLLCVACGGGGLAIPTTAPTATATPAVTATVAPVPTVTPPPSATPTATLVVPTATRAPATPTASGGSTATGTPASREPNGTVPQGWSIYRGTRLPFVLAYPPDWSVDMSQSEAGAILFRSPAPAGIEVAIGTSGKADPAANVDVLREQYNKEQAQGCRRSGIDFTRYTVYSAITFATVGANCDVAAGLSFYWIGVGLKEQVPWRFRVSASKDKYDQSSNSIFNPMMSTLNIYANPSASGGTNDFAQWPTDETAGKYHRAYDAASAEYRVALLTDNTGWSFFPPDEPKIADFVLDVSVRQVAGGSGAEYGLTFRVQPKGADSTQRARYIYRIDSDGHYELYIVNADGTTATIQTLAPSPPGVIKTGVGAVNRLTVTCKGDKIILAVNGTTLNSYTATITQPGSIGITVSAPAMITGVEVGFKDLRLTPA